jgi:hypothetical protein
MGQWVGLSLGLVWPRGNAQISKQINYFSPRGKRDYLGVGVHRDTPASRVSVWQSIGTCVPGTQIVSLQFSSLRYPGPDAGG